MRVAVVGAGITGLALTHYLANHDVDVVAFEADSQPGGVIASDRVDGRVVEYGPQRLRLSPILADLVAELGLRDELLMADGDLPLYVYVDGRLREVPRSVRTFLRTDLLSWRGKLRLLAEPLSAPADGRERAATMFERKFGAEAYRNVVEPLYGGIYASDPATMPVEHSLSGLLALEVSKGSLLRPAVERLLLDGELPPPISFADGLQRLPEALYEAHRPYVHLGTAVDAITDGSDGGYVLETGSRSVDADHVVVTAPAPAAASLLEPLEGTAVDPLRSLTYNSLVLVHLHADVAVEGFGYQVRRDEPLETLGVTWNDSLFDRDGVYTAFLGGMWDPDAVERDDEALGELARREFRHVVGADAEVLAVTKLPGVLPAFDSSWDGLSEVVVPDGVTLAANYTTRLGVPSRIREAKQLADHLAEAT